jgi:hypothetical protein
MKKNQIHDQVNLYNGLTDDEKRGMRFTLKVLNIYTDFETARFIVNNRKCKDQAEHISRLIKQQFGRFEIKNLDVLMDNLQFEPITAEQLKCVNAAYRYMQDFGGNLDD